MIRHLVLLGAGAGHRRFLQSLQKKRAVDIAITLITRQELHIDRAQLLRAIAGEVAMENCGELIEPLLRSAGVNWLDQDVTAIDASAKVLLLDDARELRFDWLSIDLESAHNRDQAELLLPGARANGMFLHPREAFCKLWPRVAELAAAKPLRVAIVCAGAAAQASGAIADADATAPIPLQGDATTANAALPTPLAGIAAGMPQTPASASSRLDWPQEKFAVELAFAVRQAFTTSAVTLITGGQPVAAQASHALRASLQSALRKHRITVLADAAIAIQTGALALRSGAHLACDVPLLALHWTAHPLLAQSGLALDETGSVDVNGGQRSKSHAHVFASDGVDATDARAQAISASLRAVVDGKQPARLSLPSRGLSPSAHQTLRVSRRHSIVSWGRWAWSSWLVW